MNAFVREYLEKKGYRLNALAGDIIGQADDWYRIRETDAHKMVTVNGEHYSLSRMGFAKRAAADDANLCEVTEINAGANDEAVHEILDGNGFDTQYREQLELTSAEGTVACYVRLDGAELMTDGSLSGGEIRLNYIDAGGYQPLTVENGEVAEAAFWGDSYRGTETVTTLVICTRDESGTYSYETVTFDRDGNRGESSTRRLGEVRPFAVMRTAEVNSIDGMRGYGYPKVYGSIPVFLGLDAAFTALFGDVDSSEKLTFINERVCGFDDAGQPITPNSAMKRRFVFLGDKLPEGKSLVDTVSPEIRVEMFKPTIELLLSAMSMKFGYGTKKYSFEQASVQTASQYIGERQDMMQELNKQRYQAKQYIEGIIRAALWFSNAFRGTSFNLDEEIQIEFDDSYIESRAERLESYRQDAVQGLGGVRVRALYLQEKYNLDEAEALKWATMEESDYSEGSENDVAPSSGQVREAAKTEAGKTLNGAQTQSLLAVIAQLSAGSLTEGQAAGLIATAIGVTREEAIKIIRGT